MSSPTSCAFFSQIYPPHSNTAELSSKKQFEEQHQAITVVSLLMRIHICFWFLCSFPLLFILVLSCFRDVTPWRLSCSWWWAGGGQGLCRGGQGVGGGAGAAAVWGLSHQVSAIYLRFLPLGTVPRAGKSRVCTLSLWRLVFLYFSTLVLRSSHFAPTCCTPCPASHESSVAQAFSFRSYSPGTQVAGPRLTCSQQQSVWESLTLTSCPSAPLQTSFLLWLSSWFGPNFSVVGSSSLGWNRCEQVGVS